LRHRNLALLPYTRCFSSLYICLVSLICHSPLYFYLFFFHCYDDHRDLHSFPTRRSSDLYHGQPLGCRGGRPGRLLDRGPKASWTDRKSTRLNSSHLGISYAVFCLKKKKKKQNLNPWSRTC